MKTIIHSPSKLRQDHCNERINPLACNNNKSQNAKKGGYNFQKLGKGYEECNLSPSQDRFLIPEPWLLFGVFFCCVG